MRTYSSTLLFGVSFFLAFLISPAIAHATTYTSNGSGGGNWTTGSTWSGGSAPSNVSTDDIVIVSGDTVTDNIGTATTTINSLWIKSGGTLTHTANTTTRSKVINFSMASTTIESGATVTANGLGYTGASTNGAAGNGTGGGVGQNYPNWFPAGGSYGAYGGGGSGVNTTYGDPFTPFDLGSGGGGGTGTGGAGGGVIALVGTGTITIHGTVSANGGAGGTNTCAYGGGGGGSGGSVYVSASILAGAGTVTSNGGDGGTDAGPGACGRTGGGGSGGRIALHYTTSSFSGSVTLIGGTYGSPGIGTYANIDDGNSAVTMAGGIVTIGSAVSYTSFTATSTSIYILSGKSLTITGTFTTQATTTIGNAGTITLGTLTVGSGGIIVGGAGTFSMGSATIQSGGMYTATSTTQHSFSSLTINSGGTMIHQDNSTTEANKLNLNITGNFTLNSGAQILVNSLGYDAGYGTGVGGNHTGYGGGCGGGYGGAGESGGSIGYGGACTGGSTYGSASTPSNIGSGGGWSSSSAQPGGSGGGSVVITVSGTATVNGAINANGQDGVYNPSNCNGAGGGGSGGTIYINASTMAGSGAITANGGAGGVDGGCSRNGHGGGGGRIVLLNTTSTYTGSATASKGSSASDGTVYPTLFFWRGATSSSWTTASNWLGGVAPSTTSDVAVVNGSITTSPVLNSTVGLAGISVGTTSSSTLILGSSAAITVGSTYNFIIGASGILFQNNTATTSITGDVTVQSGGNITHAANSTTKTAMINLSISGNFDLQSGSTINVSGLGYSGGATNSLAGNGPGGGGAISGDGCGGGSTAAGSGGGYGGNGGLGATNGVYVSAIGPQNGSYSSPYDLGSGGAAGECASSGGAAGGGSVVLNVGGTATISGSITANASSSAANGASGVGAGGGGAGGTVNITAVTLAGSGAITANGSNGGSSNPGGGGSGGRIALIYSSVNNNTSALTVAGGTGNATGDTGTTAVIASATNDITLSGNAVISSNTSYRNFTASSSALYIAPAATLTATGTFTSQTNTTLGVYGTATFSNYTVTASSTLGGTGTFSGGVGTISGATLTSTSTTQRSFTSLTLTSSATLTHQANTTAKTHFINFSISGALTVGNGSTISADSKGYTGGASSAAAGSGSGGGAAVNSGAFAGAGGGGGNGGYGGAGSHNGGGVGGAGGPQNGSTTTPADLGSGGAAGESGGSNEQGQGGGLVSITVGTTATINGSITANGGAGKNGASGVGAGGGGAGGSVYIVAQTIMGSGTITATGGAGGTSNAGGGGSGGRVALIYNRRGSGYSLVVTVTGGTGNATGGTGTTYFYKQNIRIKVSSSQNLKKTTNLVGLWSFDAADISGTIAYDRSGNGNNGTLVNGSTFTAGRVGQAAQFDGIDDKMTISGVTLSTTFTVAMWVYPAHSSDAYGALLSSAATDPGIYYKGTQKKISFYYSGTDHLNNSDVSENTWHYVVIVNSAGSVTFYIDGAADGTASSALGFTPVTLGDDSSSNTFKGKLDDVRMYNTALTAAQVTALYRLGVGSKISASPTKSVSSGLVGYWTFNGPDLTSTTAIDRSGQGNNGTRTGTTPVIGELGQALSFNGTSDSISVPLNLSGTNVVSVSSWVKTATSDTNNNIVYEFTANSNTVNGAFVFFINWCCGGGDKSLLQIRDGSGKMVGPYFTRPSNGVGVWHHYVTIYNIGGSAGNRVVLYRDGVLQTVAGYNWDDQALTGNFANSTLYIGGQGGGSQFYNGSLDDVRIYNVALTSAQVMQLYKAGTVTIRGSVTQ